MGKTLEDKKIALNMANRAATGAMSRKTPPAFVEGDPQAFNRHMNMVIDAVDNAKVARHDVKTDNGKGYKNLAHKQAYKPIFSSTNPKDEWDKEPMQDHGPGPGPGLGKRY